MGIYIYNMIPILIFWGFAGNTSAWFTQQRLSTLDVRLRSSSACCEGHQGSKKRLGFTSHDGSKCQQIMPFWGPGSLSAASKDSLRAVENVQLLPQHPEKMPRDWQSERQYHVVGFIFYQISHMCAQFISQIPFARFIKYPTINVYKLHYFYHISHY